MTHLNVVQVADLLKVSRRTVYNMISDGRLQVDGTFPAGGWRVTKESVDEAARLKLKPGQAPPA